MSNNLFSSAPWAQIMTAAEVAEALGVDRSIVSRRVKAGQLPAHRVSGVLVFWAPDVLAYGAPRVIER